MVLKNALLLAGVAVADKAKSDITNAYVEKAFPVIVEELKHTETRERLGAEAGPTLQKELKDSGLEPHQVVAAAEHGLNSEEVKAVEAGLTKALQEEGVSKSGLVAGLEMPAAAQVLHDAHFIDQGYPYKYPGQPLSYNPYGFPLSSTGIPIVQQLADNEALGSHDVVGTTFWIACNAMLAFTVFFLIEMNEVPKQWKRSICVAALVCGVAFWNYIYMKDTWSKTQQSPTAYRYTDWLITVPLQICEFYLILAAVMDVNPALFWKLMGSSVMMLLCGWFGEAGIVSVLVGFVPGCLFWLYIIYEVFLGEASQVSAKSQNEAMKSAFNTLRLIVSVGWCIYPIGYYVTYLIAPGTPGNTAFVYGYHSQSVINIVYNVADLVNKGAFGMAIYSAACMDK
mmetsp:Transcript_16699/g.41333  ORF Transcript_16699/g.41333 Transcript_16699/m.41333 type:complete len:397 (+) Transcript_16699:286-1476(+)|eukprot:CAMPEP_0178991822 /NCGR_PEP_ID=MMETSP0795-20121207/5753_1 /TAXON_ID=88552 /ORGANISM="Amoebophrya sp., Strain Ameob2" /LENGTH=396 /DNA_ID=CAMNT_0020683597 /DNA_START=268 /DNA_END=1458 /DNA_ORIENTATION=-